MEGVVNVVLKGRGGVIEAKGQYKSFKEAKAYTKSCFLLIAFSDVEVIKSSNNIKLYIDFSIIESI